MAAMRRQRARSPGPKPRGGGFRLYQDRAGQWRWRLVAANGRIVADSAEGYKRRAGARIGARVAARLMKESDPCA